jgi:DDE superfamily endonuclease
MTQRFYARYILPEHMKHLQTIQARQKRKYLFQEDGDASHGTRSFRNPPADLKRAAGLAILPHPAQSPDLNPIEAIWQIIKQRLRGSNWQTVAEFKAAIQREWHRISQQEIRKRIAEMPWRCQKVVELGGARVRSNLW